MGEPIAEVGYLAGLCGHDGTGWLKVKTDANGYLYVVGTGTAGAIEVTQDTPGDLLVGQHQYDGSAWRKSNLIFGYNDRILEVAEDTDVGAGTQTLEIAVDTSGYVWVITAVCFFWQGTSCSFLTAQITDGTNVVDLESDGSPTSGLRLFVRGEFVLKAGDKIQVKAFGLTAGDDLYLRVNGYKMKIDM